MSDEVPFLGSLISEFIKENGLVRPSDAVNFFDQSYNCRWVLGPGQRLCICYLHKELIDPSFYDAIENPSIRRYSICDEEYEKECKRKHFDKSYYVVSFSYTIREDGRRKEYILDVDCKNVEEFTEEFHSFMTKHGIFTSEIYEEDPIKEPDV